MFHNISVAKWDHGCRPRGAPWVAGWRCNQELRPIMVTFEITIQRKRHRRLARRGRAERARPVSAHAHRGPATARLGDHCEHRARHWVMAGCSARRSSPGQCAMHSCKPWLHPATPFECCLCVEDDGLKTLHWQRLCGPLDGGWSFLSLQQRTLFSLYLPAVTDRRFPPDRPP